MKAEIQIDIAGHSKELFLHSVHSSCGPVQNGLAFHFTGEGSWVMSFEEFDKLYRTVLALRGVK